MEFIPNLNCIALIPLLLLMRRSKDLLLKGLKPLQVWQSPKYPCQCPSPAPHLASLHHRELDFYRKYNEQAELQLAGQGDTISKPRATQRRVIGQIISLISLQLTLSPAQQSVVHPGPQPHNSSGACREEHGLT